MTGELERIAGLGAPRVPSRDERAHKKGVEKLVHQTRFAGVKVDAEAAITNRIMERAVDLDNQRRALANGDPVLDGVLARIEIGFVDKAMKIQKGFGSEFPL